VYYEALQQFGHDRRERLADDAAAERLASGTTRRRSRPIAALALLLETPRRTARLLGASGDRAVVRPGRPARA
jgi:hypothetical protein